MNRVTRLVKIAQGLADERQTFFDIKGAGVGDRDTNSFMAELRARAKNEFGQELSEQRICGKNHLSVDFYFPEEKTVVEVSLSLRNPNSEFERDILKAIMVQESGHGLQRLLFLTKPGAMKRHSQPSSRAIIDWARRKHAIQIEIHELVNNHNTSKN